MPKSVRKQQLPQAGSCIEFRHHPSLVDLVQELKELREQFQALRRRHPVEPASEENLPLRFPLNVRWRPGTGEGEPRSIAAEVIVWAARLRVHLLNLERYFLDWQARPEALDRFPLSGYARIFRGYQGVGHDDLLGKLNEHLQLLLIEAEKQRVLLRETLPHLLRQARSRLGWSQALAADDLGVSVDTYKSWEQGRAFPRGMSQEQVKRFLGREPEPKPGRPPSSGEPL